MKEIIISNSEAPGTRWWSGKVPCPGTNERTKDVFCPIRERCELPEIVVKADSSLGAEELIAIAAGIGEIIDQCLNRRPYFLPNRSYTIPVQPSFGPEELEF